LAWARLGACAENVVLRARPGAHKISLARQVLTASDLGLEHLQKRSIL
jgi:hypothetical protein